MQTRGLEPERLGRGEDWVGNNAAFTCPAPDCGQVFIVSGALHRNGRPCPNCGQSKGFVVGGKASGGTAKIEWRGP
jgi:hypothetical protein